MSREPLKVEIDHHLDNFPRQGILISAIDIFISQCGSKDVLDGLTTEEVCHRYLLPLTEIEKTSYCELLLKTTPNLVGPANIFVSHAWKCEFLEVISAVKSFVATVPHTGDELILWFDLFSNNQHHTAHRPFEWWKTTFCNAISVIGHTLLVMAPWKKPLALTRAWCLFEIYSTVVSGALLDVAIIPSELTSFRTDICNNYDLFYKFLASVDLRNSEASNMEDRTRIFQVVEQSSGFSALNEKVISHLRYWMRNYLEKQIISDLADGAEPFSCHRDRNALAVMFKTQGMYAEAISVWEDQLEAALQAKGADSEEALGAQNNIAAMYRLQRRFDEAEPLFNHALQTRRRILGAEHPKTLNSMNSFGLMLRDAGKYSEALLLLGECLSIRERLFTLRHDDTLKSLHNLATTHAKLVGNEAVGIDLASQSGLVGDTSDAVPSILNSMPSGHPVSYADEAERGLLKCLSYRETQLGHHHPNTLETKSELGYLYMKLGKLVEAEQLLHDAYNFRREKLGEGDVSVLKVHTQLLACREAIRKNRRQQFRNDVEIYS